MGKKVRVQINTAAAPPPHRHLLRSILKSKKELPQMHSSNTDQTLGLFVKLTSRKATSWIARALFQVYVSSDQPGSLGRELCACWEIPYQRGCAVFYDVPLTNAKWMCLLKSKQAHVCYLHPRHNRSGDVLSSGVNKLKSSRHIYFRSPAQITQDLPCSLSEQQQRQQMH